MTVRAGAPLARFELPTPAPREVSELLEQVLQNVATADPIDREEDERMLRRLRADTLDVLATEGYFSPELAVGIDDSGRSRYLLLLNLGARTQVTEVTIEFTGELAEKKERADEFRAGWELPPGEPFRQERWSAAKTRLLNRIRGRDFAAARIADSVALIKAEDATARLRVEIDSGRAFTLGPIEVRGLSRFDRDLVDRFSNLAEGEPYDADRLLEFQRRLQRSPFFGTVIVDVDPERAEGSMLPVLVEVREARAQRLSF